MTAILELNDSEILVARGGKIVVRSPGVAVVKDDRIETGERAAQMSHLNPRLTFNRYWNDLSQDELGGGNPQVRHNADLAYAHLLAIHEQAGKPGQFIVAVPGSFSPDQLSLLLGLAEASPFRIAGLIDTATAAVASAPARAGICRHVDLQLHNAVVTTLRVSDFVERTAVKLVHGAGLLAFHDRCASFIAGLFIQQARLDPLHHAPTEQALYDQLPAVLRDLQRREEVQLELRLESSRYQAKIARASLLQALQPLYDRLAGAAGSPLECVLSHRVTALPLPPGFLAGAETLGEMAALTGAGRHAPAPGGDAAAVSFITRLRRTEALKDAVLPVPEKPADVDGRATHVLIGHTAWPILDQPIYVAPGMKVSRRAQPDSLCSVAAGSAGADVRPEGHTAILVNGRKVDKTAKLNPGDVVTFAGVELTMQGIRVEDHGAP